jgi:methionine synthase II (cobalamin-independent)
MLLTSVVGSWPPEERNRSALALYFRGQMDEPESELLLKEVAAMAIAQQQACGLGENTSGETSADSFILHMPRFLIGIESTDQRDAWGGRGSYAVIGSFGAPIGLGIAAAFRRERTIEPLLAKVTIQARPRSPPCSSHARRSDEPGMWWSTLFAPRSAS